MQMKDSKISWIGKIPDHWKILPNKYIFNISKNIVDNPEKYQLLSLTTKGVKDKDENDLGGKVPDNYNGYQRVNKGDLILCLFDLDCSAVFSGLSNARGMISPAYKIVNTKVGIGVNDYFKYLFAHAFNGRHYKQYSKSLRFTVNSDEFLRIKSIVPPIEEQLKIANYLDKKCGEIDGLICDIEKEIEVLTQYKKSIITETVTKGLDKNAKLKSTDIKWADKIPEHWNIKKGKYCLKYIVQPIKDSDDIITCFRDGEVTLRKNRREEGFTMADKEIGYQGINEGDLVVHGMDGFAGAIGISDSRGKASPVLNVLDTKENKKYIMYYLRSLAFNDVFTAMSTGIRVRSCDLRWNKLAELLYILPPVEEQNQIVDYLDNKINKINSVLEDKNKQLETLESYKKSIIYEYVTGKKEVK